MIRSIVAAIALSCAASQVSANVVNISSTNGVQSASASFAFSNGGGQNRLDITLTNTMTTNGGPNWLTGLFFDIAGAPALTNAATAGNMITLNGTTQTPYNTVTSSHFWAFRDDLSGTLQGQQYGLGAAGFDVFGSADIIDLQAGGPDPQPNGTDGGILANIAGLTVPGGHQGKPFVLGSLVFSFFLPGDFDVDNASVDNVAFVFGTGFNEIVLPPNGPPPPVVPVPMALPMAMVGLVGIAAARKRILATK